MDSVLSNMQTIQHLSLMILIYFIALQSEISLGTKALNILQPRVTTVLSVLLKVWAIMRRPECGPINIQT